MCPLSRFRALTLLQRGQAMLGCALLLDTLVLLAKARVNAGTVLPGVIGIGLLLLLWQRERLARLRLLRGFALAWRGLQIAAGLWLASLLLFVGVLLQHARAPLTDAPAAILVLGAGVHGREPTPLLVKRMTVAAELARRFPQARVAVSGGQGNLEEISEAAAMADWLAARGVAPTRLLQEGRSTSTAENFAFSRAVLAEVGVDVATQPVVAVTSDFHVLRAGRIARCAGYAQASMAAAPTPWSILFNVYLREYFAWSKSLLLGETCAN